MNIAPAGNRFKDEITFDENSSTREASTTFNLVGRSHGTADNNERSFFSTLPYEVNFLGLKITWSGKRARIFN
jgi:hypothetical protein